MFFSIIPHILSVVLTAGSSDPSKLAVENCEFGETYAFTTTQCEIALTNAGDIPIRVFDIKPATADDSVEPAQLTLAPHEQAYLHVKLNTGNAVANTHHKFHFRTDESGHEERSVSAYGFVMTVLDQAKPGFDFGVVDLDSKLPQKSIELSSHESANFKISKILEKPDYLDVSIASDRHTLIARVLSTAEWGLHADYVKLEIDTPQQKQAWVEVKADVHGDVVPASNPFDMSLMRFGNHNEFLIRVTSRSGKDFKTGKLELEGVKGDAKILPCQPETSGCRMIALTVSDQQPAGAIKGKIWLELPDYQRRLPIAVWGLILAKDVKVQSLDQKPKTDADGNAVGPQKSQNATTTDLHQALKSVVQKANDAPPSGTGPLLKWTVANGMLIYGFQVFRSDSETGQFVLVNTSTIRSNVDNNDPFTYQWRDNTAESGKAYWYYVGLINKDGSKQQLSGPQKVVAK